MKPEQEEDVTVSMPINVGDLFAETDDLSPEEFAAYVRLQLHMWTRGGTLPHDPQRLARLARIDRAAFESVWQVVGKLFAHATGGLTHTRLVQQLERAREVRASMMEKARKGGRATSAKRKQLTLGLPPEAVPEAVPEAALEASPQASPQAHVIRSATGDHPDPDSGLSASSFPQILRLFSEIWTERYGETYMATPQDRSNLGRALRAFPGKEAIAAYPWEAAFRNYLADMSGWAAGEKRHSLVNFCTGGGLNKYRVSDPTAGYSQREIRSIQAGAKFDDVMAAFERGPNGRTR